MIVEQQQVVEGHLNIYWCSGNIVLENRVQNPKEL